MAMIKFSVGSASQIIKRFFRKLNEPYKVNITSENTLQEVMVVHLTKKSVYLFLSSIFVALFILLSLLILYTPLKYYLPGNNEQTTRKKLIELSVLSDSLIKLHAIREKYILNVIQIANGRLQPTLDTTLLTPQQIEDALRTNDTKIDRAKNYEYLKNQKVDSLNVDNMGTKDSI